MSSMGDGGSVPKRRKQDVQKVVVSLKAQDHKTEQGPPADRWSWRKYGQKPIKGSPHPRGYYKCSSYRDCSARKQVEKCRNDASLLIITYTSYHSHEDYATYPVQEQTHNSDKSDAGAALNNDMPLAEATAAASKLCREEETCDFYDELEELLPLPVSASPLPSLACMVQEQLL